MLEQIQKDLDLCSDCFFDAESLKNAVDKSYAFNWSTVLVQIKNNKIKTFYKSLNKKNPYWGLITQRIRVFKKALIELSKVQKLPDLSFVCCMEDLFGTPFEKEVPLFVFSKKNTELRPQILFPDSDVLEDLSNLQQEPLKGNALFPWDKKLSSGFWRGGMTGLDTSLNEDPLELHNWTVKNFMHHDRANLVQLSLDHPELLNARFLSGSLYPEGKKINRVYSSFFGDFTPIPLHLQYKYQILVDGNSASWKRYVWQLYSNSLIIKQDSPYIQWFYGELQPYVHYIPCKKDFTDLIDLIKWAQENDSFCLEISQTAQKFAQEYLTKARMYQYIYLVLSAYKDRYMPS